MNKVKYIALCLLLGLVSLSACDNSLDQVFDEQTVVEFDGAITGTPAVGRTYPIISSGNSVTASPTLTQRLNLVGRQRSTPLTVRVLLDPAATTAPASSYTLVNDGNVVIPADSSFGVLRIRVSQATSTTAAVRNVVLVIDSTSTDFKPSQNYKRIGYSIRQ